jgi:hypothetical protein
LTVFGIAGRVSAQASPWSQVDTSRLLLTPDKYPKLPGEIRDDLVRRGCRIPQASGPDTPWHLDRHPNNVISGSFTAAHSRDWAVLCSIRDSSRILVYVDSKAARVDSLAPQGDAGYLGKEEGHDWGYSRVIYSVPPKIIRNAQVAFGEPAPRGLDHLGIENYFAGKGGEIYYCKRGRWMTYGGMN